ncbi:MAG TPA: pilus assembly PilX N-terminal domain-containing protein, partial [Phycisphaerae bacterium]|nr:pilus assembly PilX N-terminal domain-containing protein [Phycisphaerae bacterium]
MRSRPKTRRAATRRGIALLITLIFLALFACLAVAIATSADANLTMARNRIETQQAAALAEAGIQLSLRHLAGLSVLDTHEAADLHEAMAEHLEAEWASSSMLQASAITWNSTGVSVPTISVSRTDGRTGRIELAIAASGGAADNTSVTIQSTGRFGRAVRTATYNMTAQRGTSILFQHGIASKSTIRMSGDARLQGANNPDEGSILSASYSTSKPI